MHLLKKIEFGDKGGPYYCIKEIDKNGESHGKTETFLSGVKVLVKNYKHGKLHGKEREFNKNGIKIFEATYRYGKLNGIVAYYDAGGNKISEFMYKGNRLVKHDA